MSTAQPETNHSPSQVEENKNENKVENKDENKDEKKDENKDESQVTPWSAKGTIDYERLVRDFGTTPITDQLLQRMEKIINKPLHPWLKRKMFFSHRSLDEILTLAEQKKPFYLYTGRGPSSGSLHLGHLLPFFFTKWLQDVFDVPLVIQLTDDEKFLFRDISLETINDMTINNAKDIIAVGFDPKKTFIFKNTEYMGQMYTNVLKIQSHITASQSKGCFGFNMNDSIGKWSFPAIQAAPSFSSTFPIQFGKDSNYHCLIPCAIDQDPFFRMTRDVAPKLQFNKPACIHSKFFPSLQGKEKMSASDPQYTIFMSDTQQQIEDKVKKFAFSGGRDTAKLHRELGGRLELDVPYKYLTFFEHDDEKLNHVAEEFKSGRMLSSGIKKVLVDCLIPIVKKHQDERAKITDEYLQEFFTPKPFQFNK